MIAVLDPVKGESAVAWRMLGDSYLHLGWLDKAKANYEWGLRYAIRTQDWVEQGHTQAGLAHVYAARKDWTESIRWLQKAKAEYDKAGVLEEAKTVESYEKILQVLEAV